MSNKPLTSLIGLTNEQTWLALQQINKETGKRFFKEKFRAKIVNKHIYSCPGKSFVHATSLRPDQRQVLDQYVQLPEVVKQQTSTDGTVKWLLSTSVGNVETVYIPELARVSLCISSQAGCSLNCKFCHTGTQKLIGNLTSGDIVSQVLHARVAAPHPVTNVLFMGQGEPLLNFTNVSTAISILTNEMAIPARKITVSTSGIAKHIPALAHLGVKLAVSLHAATDDLRQSLMPAASQISNLSEVFQAVQQYVEKASSRTRTVTFEWIMIKGITDTPQQAKRLISLIARIPCSLNLIPFNPWPGSAYQPSDTITQAQFIEKLRKSLDGHSVMLRRPRGSDILAACGQLKS